MEPTMEPTKMRIVHGLVGWPFAAYPIKSDKVIWAVTPSLRGQMYNQLHRVLTSGMVRRLRED